MRRGWDTALEAQNTLRASFHTVPGARYLAAFSEALTGEGKMFNPETLQAVAGDPRSADGAVQNAIATVEWGDPMWVSEGVVELVEHAAETFRPEQITPHDLFVKTAFAYLERPLRLVDVNGKLTCYRAVSWGPCEYENNPGKQGVVIAMWSDFADQDDFHDDRLRQIGGSSLTLMHSGDFPFFNEGYLRDPTYKMLVRQLQVMWRLARQEVVVPGRERVSRPVWRRKSNWRAIKEVQVLRLRRARPAKYEGEERDVEWSHRWIVHGHWRNQWYPSLGRHYQIYINPYVKGPEGAPFIEKKHAIEFIR